MSYLIAARFNLLHFVWSFFNWQVKRQTNDYMESEFLMRLPNDDVPTCACVIDARVWLFLLFFFFTLCFPFLFLRVIHQTVYGGIKIATGVCLSLIKYFPPVFWLEASLHLQSNCGRRVLMRGTSKILYAEIIYLLLRSHAFGVSHGHQMCVSMKKKDKRRAYFRKKKRKRIVPE